jgi:hypothetical protein
MEAYVKADGSGFDFRLRVNWLALTAFINALKATGIAMLLVLLIRLLFG